MRRTVASGAWVALAAAGLMVALAACTPEAPMPTPTDAPDPSASAAPEPPRELDLQGTALDNLPYFNDVNHAFVDPGGVGMNGRAFIDNLVAAGFPKEAMEVTPDRTSINAEVDQIQFSVRINGTCLVGQFGSGVYSGTATTLLSDGRCLIGTTRPIDW